MKFYISDNIWQVIFYNYYLVLYHHSTLWGIAVIWICYLINGHDIGNRFQIVLARVCLPMSLYLKPVSCAFLPVFLPDFALWPHGYQRLRSLLHHAMETFTTLVITGHLWEESTGLWWIPLTKVPVIPSFGVCSLVSLNQRMNKQPS